MERDRVNAEARGRAELFLGLRAGDTPFDFPKRYLLGPDVEGFTRMCSEFPKV